MVDGAAVEVKRGRRARSEAGLPELAPHRLPQAAQSVHPAAALFRRPGRRDSRHRASGA